MEELSQGQKEWFSAIRANASKKYQMKRQGAIQMPMGWPPELDRRLIRGVVECGYGNWKEFAARTQLELLPMLCPSAKSYEALDSEEKFLVTSIIKGRTADIAMSVSKEYCTRLSRRRRYLRFVGRW